MKASSVIHAHTHIVNHEFINEEPIVKNLNFKRLDNLNYLSKQQNYIMYINPENICYVSYDFFLPILESHHKPDISLDKIHRISFLRGTVVFLPNYSSSILAHPYAYFTALFHPFLFVTLSSSFMLGVKTLSNC